MLGMVESSGLQKLTQPLKQQPNVDVMKFAIGDYVVDTFAGPPPPRVGWNASIHAKLSCVVCGLDVTSKRSAGMLMWWIRAGHVEAVDVVCAGTCGDGACRGAIEAHRAGMQPRSVPLVWLAGLHGARNRADIFSAHEWPTPSAARLTHIFWVLASLPGRLR